jgi:ketosteroid isomerase-like protein
MPANLQLVRDAFAAADPSEASRLWDPEIEWVIAREHPDARILAGPEAVMSYVREWESTLTGLQVEIDRLLDAGERVVAVGSVGGAGSESGAGVRVPIAFVVTAQDGLITRVEEYLEPAEALAVAGLDADGLDADGRRPV